MSSSSIPLISDSQSFGSEKNLSKAAEDFKSCRCQSPCSGQVDDEVCGMSSISVGRIIVVLISLAILIVALALCIAAVVTPAWQVVYLAEFQAEHQHGLWLDCTVNKRYNQGLNTAQQCTYKFESAYYDPTTDYTLSVGTIHQEETQHMWHGWHQACLVFFLIAFISGLIALCFIFCAPCIRICAIVSNVFLLISTVTMFVGLAIFFFNAHKHDTRFVHGVTMTYEQTKGYSFYIGVGSLICFFFSFLLSIPSTVLIFLHDKQKHQPKRPVHPNGTNVTVVRQQPISV
ncbi:Clc-like protein 2 [Aphelenchoides bicaudatus]|nr:Clc-like protein 2 [Aphelenchoides bicaudatus]